MKSPSPFKHQTRGWQSPAGIALLYAGFAALWIVLSGYLLTITVADPLLQSRIELAKGLTFVAVTGGLLYLLLKGWRESFGMPPTTSQINEVAPPKTIRLVLMFFALALVVPLIDLAIYSLHVPQTKQDTYDNLKSIAQLKAEEIENWLNERRGDAQVLADNTGFAKQVEQFLLHQQHDGLPGHILNQLGSLQANYGYDSILLLDNDGHLLSSVGQDVDTLPRHLLRQAQSSRQVQFSNLYRDEAGHINLDWIVPIIVSDRHGKRAVAAVVLRVLPEKFLYPLIQTWPTDSASGETLLVRHEGGNVLLLNQLRFRMNTALALHGKLDVPDLPAAIAIRENKPGTVTGLDYRHVQVLAAFRPVAGTDWHLVAKIDRDEALNPVWKLLYWISAVASVAVALIMATLVILLRQQQRAHQLALRTRTMEVLKDSELHYRTLVGTIPDLVWLKNKDGIYLNCNRQFEKLYGAEAADIVGKSDYDFVDKKMADSFRKNDLLAIATGRTNSNEEWLTFAENGYRGLFETIKTPMTDSKGNLVGVLGIARDITLRKQGEQKLAASEMHFHSLFENMLEGYAYCKMIYRQGIAADFAYIDVNRAFETLTGLKGVVGKNVSEVIPGIRETDPELFDIYSRVAMSGQPEQFEIYVDGLGIWFSIAVYSPEKEYFVAVFDNITERKAAEAKIARLTQLYAALSECNQAIVRCNSAEELFPLICRNAVQLGGMSMAWIGMVDEAGKQVRPVASYGTGTAYLNEIQISADANDPFGRGPTGTAIRDNRPYWNQDFQLDPNTAPWQERRKKYTWKSSASLPLLRNGTPVGSITFYSDTVNAFDEEARRLLTEMAADISFALDNFDRDLQRKQAQQEIIYKNTILQTQQETTLDAILVVDENGKIISCNQKFIVMWRLPPHLIGEGADEPVLQLVADQAENMEAFVARVRHLYEHHNEQSREEIRLKDGRVIDRYSAPVIGTDGKYYGRVWYFRDISQLKRAAQELMDSEQRFRGLVEQSLAGIYILQEGKLVYVNPRFIEILGHGSAGKLIGRAFLQYIAEADQNKVAENIRQIVDKEKRDIASEFVIKREDGSMITIGSHTAYAIYRGQQAIIGLIQDISEKKRDEEKILNYTRQLKTAFLSTVQLATSLSEMRDPYTAGHERRVSDIAVAIASELGLDEQRIEGIKIAGYLHDIGKISIPAEILVKPGRLSATEYVLVQGHAQASYDVLKHVEFPWPVATVALQHHERMDGSGYPNGLKGDEILLESRIIAVADVVEAMASHRPYRPGMGIDKALTEIERGRGTAYDPEVADACLRLFREKGFVLPPH